MPDPAMNPDPSSHPQPNILSYSPAHSSGGQIFLRIFFFLLGMAGGVVGIGFLGFALWGAAGYDYRHSPSPRPLWPAVVFFALLIVAFTICFLVFRRFRHAAKWLLLGLLIAAGFASLGEGIRFLNQ